jgi:hypothetical protein
MSMVAIAKLRRDGGTQPRATLDAKVIEEYAEDMKSGAKFPPVVAFFDGADYWLADGFHRVGGANVAGLEEIEAEIKQGSQRDAVLYSVGVNAAHGCRRTNEDKRRSVLRLLEDSEWSAWSNVEVSKRCSVSEAFVRSLRTKRSETEQPAARQYTTKHGTQATMHTENIGRREPREEREPEPELDERQDAPESQSDDKVSAVIRDTQMYLDVVFKELKDVSAKHRLAHETIKFLRAKASEFDRMA